MEELLKNSVVTIYCIRKYMVKGFKVILHGDVNHKLTLWFQRYFGMLCSRVQIPLMVLLYLGNRLVQHLWRNLRILSSVASSWF